MTSKIDSARDRAIAEATKGREEVGGEGGGALVGYHH